jgi:hypothetical protein
MKPPSWMLPAAFGAVVVSMATVVKVVRRWPDFDAAGSLGAIGVASVGGGAAGATHHFARRLIARRPWGAYLYGIIIGETYLFAIMGALTVAKLVDAPGLVAPGRADPFSDWHHWPWFAALGVVCGLVWGFLSRHEEAGEPDVGG